MSSPALRRTLPRLIACGALVLLPILHAQLPEPGPENSGMRLRLMIQTSREGTNDIHRVRVDLTNVTDQPIRLLADWPGTANGSFQEYLVADLSIQTEPAIMPFAGQVGVVPRKEPQPTMTLGAHETLTVTWTNLGRALKRTSIHPFTTHNPRFAMDGLYSVRASILLRLAEEEAKRTPVVPAWKADPEWEHFRTASVDCEPHGTILLRSNEQLVPVGDSREVPKHTLGQLVWSDTNHTMARIDLGSVHKVANGDEFQILTGYIAAVWRIVITNVGTTFSTGTLRPVTQNSKVVPDSGVLIPGARAEFLAPNDPRREWFSRN